MAKWQVTHEDGRITHAYAPDAEAAKKQQNHHEMSRAVIATRRGLPVEPPPSFAVAAEFVKD